jgi:cation diffusion facilitator CzcD-associated flavoprotein CzcO
MLSMTCSPCWVPLRLPLCLPSTDQYQLWDNIRLNTRLTGAAYDEDRAVWHLTTAGGEEEEEVQVLVLAQGRVDFVS